MQYREIEDSKTRRGRLKYRRQNEKVQHTFNRNPVWIKRIERMERENIFKNTAAENFPELLRDTNLLSQETMNAKQNK